MVDVMQHLLENLKAYATTLSFILTIGGAVISVTAKNLGSAWLSEWLRRRRSKSADDAILTEKTSESILPKEVLASSIARERVINRIQEATGSRSAELSTKKWSSTAAISLTVGQYIIGGVLASSFVQQSLTPKWVGGLGVLVLLASLFKQQFHPEIDAEDARKKASKLLALIRTSDDKLAILDAKIASGENHTDAMIALLTQITQRLTEIEDPEATETVTKAA